VLDINIVSSPENNASDIDSAIKSPPVIEVLKETKTESSVAVVSISTESFKEKEKKK